MYDKLQQLLAHRNPRFVCRVAGARKGGPDKHIAHIDHVITPPVDADTLAGMRSQLGELPELFAFYERYGSLRLYRDSVDSPGIGCASAFYIAPPEAWAELRSDVGDWFSQLDEDEAAEFLPDWVSDCVAIGEVPNSGNYFLMPMVGEERGKVFEFEHDGFEFIERGASFEDFVEKLADVNEELLRDIGGHTRYDDGVTDYQWMPSAYLHDGKSG